MSKTKFTPGPWSQDPHALSLIIGGGKVIADVLTNVPAPQHQANARLIAAAPALYEAALVALPIILGHQRGPTAKANAEALIRAALALATKENQ